MKNTEADTRRSTTSSQKYVLYIDDILGMEILLGRKRTMSPKRHVAL